MPDKKQDRENIKIDPIVKEQLDDLQYQLKRLTGDKQTQSLVIWRGLVALQREIHAGAFERDVIRAAKPVPAPGSPRPTVLSPKAKPPDNLDLKRALQNAKAEIENALSALEQPETNRGEIDRDAAEEHLNAAERELDAAEQDSPTRSSAGAGSKSRKRTG